MELVPAVESHLYSIKENPDFLEQQDLQKI